MDPTPPAPEGNEPAGEKPWNRPQAEHEASRANAGDAGSTGSSGVEVAGAVLESTGCCLEGCAGCAIAFFVGVFLTAQAAFAIFK